MNNFHTPVLLQEAIELLRIKPQGLYIDATLGGGGHAAQIVKHGGKVLALDVDEEAIEHVRKTINEEKLQIVKGNFRNIGSIATDNNFKNVDGILFDLGVSSYQLDTQSRGFSFQKEAPLDMRMDKELGVTAADLVNGLRKEELYELFTNLGEERYAFAISNNIIKSRGIKPIVTTHDLVKVIDSAIRQKGQGDVHKATRVFQALRIAVNDELHAISEALPQALQLLCENGRLVVITFHSLEDRIVKNEFKKWEEEGKAKIITKKPLIPTESEIEANRRSRSAKIRAIEKIN